MADHEVDFVMLIVNKSATSQASTPTSSLGNVESRTYHSRSEAMVRCYIRDGNLFREMLRVRSACRQRRSRGVSV